MFNLIIEIMVMVGVIIIGIIWVRYIIEVTLRRNNYNNIIPPKDVKVNKLEELVNILREDRNDKLRKEKDEELSEYAYRRMKMVPTGGIMSSIGKGLEETPIKANTHGELIPYGLSELDRAILEEFYKNN